MVIYNDSENSLASLLVEKREKMAEYIAVS